MILLAQTVFLSPVICWRSGPVSITFSSVEVGEEKFKIKAVVVSITEKKSKLVQQVLCPN
ncbi:hypothetical protein Pyn_28228 [Prunus yedoensis var. nudiflora]|uniref:Uncharacterized protein n=1 Tax=Prunus yedoensis var. nudiflora TaxID=2094558 RepID=A0A314Y124_PRUYE|nr:hypothetical protein Pyn_28228 [Prunus yedoensis var. nudiflora]